MGMQLMYGKADEFFPDPNERRDLKTLAEMMELVEKAKALNEKLRNDDIEKAIEQLETAIDKVI